jgi:hypothetical protein
LARAAGVIANTGKSAQTRREALFMVSSLLPRARQISNSSSAGT